MVGRTNTGGASLNMRIMGGNTQPTSPVENLIWLNTGIAIPHWYIQNDAPANPVEGEVYITVRTASNVVLQLLRNNGMKLYFGTAYQYQSGAWKAIGGRVYLNGEWKDLQTFVYIDGTYNANLATDISIDAHAVAGYVRTNGPEFISCVTTSATSQHGDAYYRFNQKIDLTDVKTVRIVYSSGGQDSRTGYERYFRFAISANGGYNPTAAAGTGSSSANISETSPASVDIDVSSLSGSYWIGAHQHVYSGVATVRIHSVELIS